MGLEDRDSLLAWLEHRIEEAINEKVVFSRVIDIAKIPGPEELLWIMQDELDRAIRTASRAEIARRLVEQHYKKDN